MGKLLVIFLLAISFWKAVVGLPFGKYYAYRLFHLFYLIGWKYLVAELDKVLHG